MPQAPPFPFAHSHGGNVRALAADCARQLGEPGRGLGFVYATQATSEDMTAALDTLREHTGVSDWVGTQGLGVCATGVEYYEEPALVAMVADLPPDGYRLFSGSWKSIGDLRDAHGDWYSARQAVLGLVHGDPRRQELVEQIEALAEELPAGFLAGGLSSAQDESTVQVATVIEQGALSGVLLDLERVPLRVSHSQGCSPIGPIHQVTESQRNVAISIDRRPALEVLKDDLGEVASRDLERVAGSVLAGLMIEGSDTGDYLARHLMGFDPEHGLLGIGDWLRPGQSLTFVRRDPDSARADLVRMLEHLTNGLERPPRGAVYASCLGRGRYMFGSGSAELKLIQEHLGDVPLVGFYANGEVYHQRLYGYTGVLTLFT